MFGLVTILLAAMVDAGDKGRAQELEGRLGLRRTPKDRITGLRGRLLWLLEVSKKDPEAGIRAFEVIVQAGVPHQGAYGIRALSEGYSGRSLTSLINNIGNLYEPGDRPDPLPATPREMLQAAWVYFIEMARDNTYYDFKPETTWKLDEDARRPVERVIPAKGHDLSGHHRIEPFVPWILSEVGRIVRMARDDQHMFTLSKGQKRTIESSRWTGYGPGDPDQDYTHGTGADLGHTDQVIEYAMTREILRLRSSLDRILDWAVATRPDLSGLTWRQAKHRSDAWHRELERQAELEDKKKAMLAMTAQDRLWTWDDNWYLVQLRTPADLDAETAFLGHCIGGGSYDDQVRGKDWTYFSLRSPDGEPKVTYEVRVQDYPRGQITQAKGKNNQTPAGKLYWPALRAGANLSFWWHALGHDLGVLTIPIEDAHCLVKLDSTFFADGALENLAGTVLHSPHATMTGRTFWDNTDDYNDAVYNDAVLTAFPEGPFLESSLWITMSLNWKWDDEVDRLDENIAILKGSGDSFIHLTVPLQGWKKSDLKSQVQALYRVITDIASPCLYLDDAQMIRSRFPPGVSTESLSMDIAEAILRDIPGAEIVDDPYNDPVFTAELRRHLARKKR